MVVITRDRRSELMHTLPRLLALPERLPIVLVDNASTDGTAEAVRERHPSVEVVRLEQNLGAAARTVGVRRVQTPYVAFSDDDSWWAPGSLEQAADVLDRVPRLAVVAARVVVGPDEALDPVCVQMRDSPLGSLLGAGPRVLGFVACGAVVRRAAYLEVGGFHARYGVGGEEALLAVDLADREWACAYLDSVVAHHHPSPARDVLARRACEVRNDLWTVWLRRRAPAVLGRTAGVLGRLPLDPSARAGLWQAVRGWRWVLRERHPVTAPTERELRSLQRGV